MYESNQSDCCSDGPAEVRLLGSFSASYQQRQLNFPADAQRLLAFLALRKERQPRSSVAGHLWLECSQAQAFASLRSALWRVKRTAVRLIESDSRTLGLAADVHVDVDVLDAAASALREHRDVAVADYAPFTSELLVGWHDEWAIVERERLRQISLHCLEATADQLCRRGEHASAIDAALAAIRLDHLRESSHRCLIRVHLAEGNRSEAIRVTEQYARRLRHELDIEPSPLMVELMRAELVKS